MAEILRWLSGLLRRYRGDVATARNEHIQLEQAFTECPGQWVAVDRRTGQVVASRPTPYELAAYLKSSRIHNVDVIRAPAEHEPEMVGFG